ncbi:hypothetical protein [Mumia zhuanghuii]|uniref:Uncharacterized protein n=1 Tax=Mumia zhuanghuii TaxID=2585211 RepID=A0A5C4LT30_9ACTN|nr:hypothetical protein [Mumia zhuanghuii]TNC22046.1 hypothetical protein FHE65_36235 [Mumia zhuanghuii]TNC22177.1 hypothetical protein FHE65_35860 [Mumia zhuanghuii]
MLPLKLREQSQDVGLHHDARLPPCRSGVEWEQEAPRVLHSSVRQWCPAEEGKHVAQEQLPRRPQQHRGAALRVHQYRKWHSLPS